MKTDWKTQLQMMVERYLRSRMPKSVNGYLVEWRVEITDTPDDLKFGTGDQVTVHLRGTMYTETKEAKEEQTPHGLKTVYITRKEFASEPDGSDVERFGHVSDGFYYLAEWLNGEYDYESESAEHYILSKAPKDNVEQIRDCMKGFVSDCVQFCVYLEKGWYR